MKKNKKQNPAQNENIHQWRKRFALGRRSEAREKQKENAEQERREIFDRKTSGASDKKAPFTLRTKGYYRFTKEYPSAVDENGFRENAPDKKAVLRRRLVTLFVCVAVFTAAFVVTESFILISQKKLPEPPVKEEPESATVFRALHFSYEEFSAGDTDAMSSKLDALGCNAAVFEFKDDTGYVMFNTGSFMGMSADRRILNAVQTVKALKAKGYTVCAYISCFKDTAASRANLTFSVRRNTYEGASWTDNSGMGWLDPYSSYARDYILEMIGAAAQNGFDRIILGNVCFSSDSGSAMQYYAWEEDSQVSRNQILLNFIGSAVKSSGSARLTVMCDYAAFGAEALADTPRYYGSLLSCAASSLCMDARLSVQQKNITLGDTTFSDASLMPYVFVLAASEYAVKGASAASREDAEILVCIENGDALNEEITAAEFSGIDGFIIW